MFNGRDPVMSDVPDETGSPENDPTLSSRPKSRRLLKKSLLTCRHCDEVFTSRYFNIRFFSISINIACTEGGNTWVGNGVCKMIILKKKTQLKTKERWYIFYNL